MATLGGLVLQLAGVALVAVIGPWAVLPALALLAIGAWLYRRGRRAQPAVSRVRRAFAGLLTGVALLGAALVAWQPWEEIDLAAERPASAAATPGQPRRCALLVHGLVNRSMDTIERALTRAGFRARTIRYDSTGATLEAMVDALAAVATREAAQCGEMHFVGYSLGGLLLRAYLAAPPPAPLGRVVMIAPPNHGTEIVDALQRLWLFRRMVGEVGAALGTSRQALPRRLPGPSYPLGIIAGDVSRNPLGAWLIPAPNDGTVSVASTRLDGMTDFLLVHRSHHFIVRSPEVAAQTVEFLREGRFRR